MNRVNIARLLQIGGTWVPGITKYNISMEDIDGEGTTRDETGVMHREVVRKKVKKLTVHCTHDSEDILAVASLVENDIFDAYLLCPGDPEAVDYYKEATFYISKITTDLVHFGDNGVIWSVAFNAVEV